MTDVEIQIAEYIRNLISSKGRDVLDNSIGLYGSICDNFIAFSDTLISIKLAAISEASIELNKQVEQNCVDCKKIFSKCKNDFNQDSLNKYLEILFMAVGLETKFIYSDVETVVGNIEIKENRVVLEKRNEKNETANDYFELAKAQRTIKGIKNQSIYIENLLKAVEMGHCEAIHIMAHYYIKGKYVPVDIDKGVMFLKKIADEGNATAAYDLYILSKRNILSFDEAFSYLKISASGGLVNAVFDLGMVYYENGGPDDYINAVKWFEKGCESEDMHSYYQLALCYRFGHGVKCDVQKAMQLLNRAAELGHYKAKEIIGG